MITLKIKCAYCGTEYNLEVNEADWEKWNQGKCFIQDCFPYLTASDRELIISNTCPKCWDKMWPEE